MPQLQHRTPSPSAARQPAAVGLRRWLVGAVLAGVAVSSSALDLPRLGKPERGAGAQPSGFAAPGRQHAEERDNREAREAAVAAQHLNGGGRVLSVEEADGGWRVKLLKEGNVRFVFVPD